MEEHDGLTSGEARLLYTELRHLAAAVGRQSDALTSISESLHLLTRLQSDHEHARQDIDEAHTTLRDHEKRLRKVEVDMPGLRELRRYVVMGVVAGLGMMGTSLYQTVFKAPTPPQAQILGTPTTREGEPQ